MAHTRRLYRRSSVRRIVLRPRDLHPLYQTAFCRITSQAQRAQHSAEQNYTMGRGLVLLPLPQARAGEMKDTSTPPPRVGKGEDTPAASAGAHLAARRAGDTGAGWVRPATNALRRRRLDRHLDDQGGLAASTRTGVASPRASGSRPRSSRRAKRRLRLRTHQARSLPVQAGEFFNEPFIGKRKGWQHHRPTSHAHTIPMLLAGRS